MADTNSPLNIAQDILLRYQVDMKGVAETTRALTALEKGSFAAGKAMQAIGATAKAVALAFTAAVDALNHLTESGRSLTQLATISGRGSDAALALKESYNQVAASAQNIVISLNDAAQAMTGFAQQGLAQLQMAGDQQMQQFVISLQNTLIQGVGDPKIAAEMTTNITGAFKDNLAALSDFKSQWLSAGTDMQKQAEVLQNFRWIDPAKMEQAMGSLKTSMEVASGSADPAIKSFVTWNNLVTQFNTTLGQLKQAFLEAFGDDISALLKGIGEWFTRFIKWIQSIIGDVKILWAGFKALLSNIGTGFKAMAQIVFGSWELIVAGASYAIGKIMSYIPGLTDAGQKVLDFSKEVYESSKKNISAGLHPEFKSITDEMAKQAIKNAEQMAKQAQAGKQIQQPFKNVNEELLAIRRELDVIIQKSENWSKSISGVSKSMQTLADLARFAGGEFKINNQLIQQMSESSMQNAIRAAKELADQSAAGLPAAEREIKILEDALQKLRSEGALKDTIESKEMEINSAYEKRDKLLDKQKQSLLFIKQILDNSLAPLQSNLDLVSSQKDLLQANLNISKALYGTPSLSIEATQAVVRSMEQEKQLLQAMLADVQNRLAEMQAQGIEAERLNEVKKMQLDLEKQIANKTSEQLNQLKELRDGYLGAVTAQALGAGKFSKILLTQEQNLGIALDKRIAKYNYLLGQTGTAAQQFNKTPVSFSASGMGILSSGGQDLNADQMRQYSQNAVQNIGDPKARELMRANIALVQQNSQSAKSTINKYAASLIKSAPMSAMQGNINAPVIQGAAAQSVMNRTTNAGGISGNATQVIKSAGADLRSAASKLESLGSIIDSIETKDNPIVPGVRSANHIPS